jgi:very-short-patch-repair endonuclease
MRATDSNLGIDLRPPHPLPLSPVGERGVCTRDARANGESGGIGYHASSPNCSMISGMRLKCAAIPRAKLRRAQELRRRATAAEERAWRVLRNRRLHGLKFRRQHVIGGFVVDFYCAARRLVLEIDGGEASPGQSHRQNMMPHAHSTLSSVVCALSGFRMRKSLRHL